MNGTILIENTTFYLFKPNEAACDGVNSSKQLGGEYFFMDIFILLCPKNKNNADDDRAKGKFSSHPFL